MTYTWYHRDGRVQKLTADQIKYTDATKTWWLPKKPNEYMNESNETREELERRIRREVLNHIAASQPFADVDGFLNITVQVDTRKLAALVDRAVKQALMADRRFER